MVKDAPGGGGLILVSLDLLVCSRRGILVAFVRYALLPLPGQLHPGFHLHAAGLGSDSSVLGRRVSGCQGCTLDFACFLQVFFGGLFLGCIDLNFATNRIHLPIRTLLHLESGRRYSQTTGCRKVRLFVSAYLLVTLLELADFALFVGTELFFRP